jgi:ribosomal-protein-serine acetyltransferase
MPRLELPSGHHLRPVEEGDAEELHALIDANRAHLARWLVWAEPQTLAQTREFLARAQRQRAANDGFQAAIIAGGRIVGMVGFHGIDWSNRATSVGYWLDRAAQGTGTMTEAVGAMVDHAFAAWGLNRVEIRLDVENVRSRALVERLGFTREGVLRQALWVAGEFRDDAVYAMLAADWRRRAAGASGASPAPGERVR